MPTNDVPAATRQVDAPPLTPATPEKNSSDLLLERVAKTPEAVLFALPDGDGWKDVTAREFLDRVRALAKGFVAAGIEPGDKIGMMAPVGYDWSLVDFAAWFAGAVLVPIYDTSSSFQVRWNLSDSGAVALVVGKADALAKFEAVRDELPLVTQVWQIAAGDLDALAASGTAVTDEDLERRRTVADEDDVATIIYTSGTTGRPKGCVLTHRNFVELSRNTQASLPELMSPGQSLVLFLTMAHVFARFIAVLCVYSGVTVAHQPDTTKLLPTLASFKPTFLLAVPRVFEKVYNASEQKAEGGNKGAIFRRAADAAIAYSKALDAGRVPLLTRLKFILFDRLVLKKMRAALGGRVRWAVSGSAPLGDRLGHFYRGLGLQILEGYGLTETTAPLTVNRPDSMIIGTVGPALPGTSIRIADDGEIQAKGVGVFTEYWRNPEATAEAFDDGWFHTGDIGELDSHGHLRITGRKKELIITAAGKNVAPAALEDPLRAHPIIGQVVVVGDHKPFIAALVTLDNEMLPVWLKHNGVEEELTLEQAAVHPTVTAEVQRAVEAANARVSRAESIRTHRILAAEWSEASGHLTPKLTIKRHVILEDYAPVLDEIYGGAASTRESAAIPG